jgi:hypothetical protein
MIASFSPLSRLSAYSCRDIQPWQTQSQRANTVPLITASISENGTRRLFAGRQAAIMPIGAIEPAMSGITPARARSAISRSSMRVQRAATDNFPSERQAEGIAKKKREGGYKGRIPTIDREKLAQLRSEAWGRLKSLGA